MAGGMSINGAKSGCSADASEHPARLPDVHVVAVSCVTVSQSGGPKSEPPDVWRCYGASVAPVATVLAAAAEMFLGAWQHGLAGEDPVNFYLQAPWAFPKTVLSSPAVYRCPLVSTPRRCPMLEVRV